MAYGAPELPWRSQREVAPLGGSLIAPLRGHLGGLQRPNQTHYWRGWEACEREGPLTAVLSTLLRVELGTPGNPGGLPGSYPCVERGLPRQCGKKLWRTRGEVLAVREEQAVNLTPFHTRAPWHLVPSLEGGPPPVQVPSCCGCHSGPHVRRCGSVPVTPREGWGPAPGAHRSLGGTQVSPSGSGSRSSRIVLLGPNTYFVTHRGPWN